MSSKPSLPSELSLTKKWDDAVMNHFMKASIGITVAGLASIVLFRSSSKRIALTTFGAGFGLGDAFRLANIEFEKDNKK